MSRQGGEVGFGLAGAAGLMVEVQASTDFHVWSPVGTCIMDAGTNYWTCPTAVREFQFFRGLSR